MAEVGVLPQVHSPANFVEAYLGSQRIAQQAQQMQLEAARIQQEGQRVRIAQRQAAEEASYRQQQLAVESQYKMAQLGLQRMELEQQGQVAGAKVQQVIGQLESRKRYADLYEQLTQQGVPPGQASVMAASGAGIAPGAGLSALVRSEQQVQPKVTYERPSAGRPEDKTIGQLQTENRQIETELANLSRIKDDSTLRISKSAYSLPKEKQTPETQAQARSWIARQAEIDAKRKQLEENRNRIMSLMPRQATLPDGVGKFPTSQSSYGKQSDGKTKTTGVKDKVARAYELRKLHPDWSKQDIINAVNEEFK